LTGKQALDLADQVRSVARLQAGGEVANQAMAAVFDQLITYLAL